MFSSSGSVAEFNAEALRSDQWDVLQNSNGIIITNAQNLQLESLTDSILHNIPPEIFVSIDFSDLTPHHSRIDGFREKLLNHPKRSPTLIAGNENEFRILAKTPEATDIEAGLALSKDFPTIFFALHTAECSYLWKGGKLLTSKRCYSVSIQHATGAGDAWHAGFLVGWKGELPLSDSLAFANAVAAYQLSTGTLGSITEILKFMKETPLQEDSEQN
jgi:fructose-1-phosphate kinase PfkB-like protein